MTSVIPTRADGLPGVLVLYLFLNLFLLPATYHVQNETDYAAGVGRGVCAGVETGKRTADPTESAVISFYGLPSDVFWSEVSKVHDTFRGRPAYRGVLIHCYARFQEYLADNPPAGGR